VSAVRRDIADLDDVGAQPLWNQDGIERFHLCPGGALLELVEGQRRI